MISGFVHEKEDAKSTVRRGSSQLVWDCPGMIMGGVSSAVKQTAKLNLHDPAKMALRAGWAAEGAPPMKVQRHSCFGYLRCNSCLIFG